ncbi:hypothetical protein DVH24_042207 [Malus domestica]|uniref:Uncharacterized protein n=1 Tax=Malus domestica TaxID=3750 RepID=A0A498IYF6_MALDO|nr:hypothetical protein DVH24_042207 [Malus domestica]
MTIAYSTHKSIDHMTKKITSKSFLTKDITRSLSDKHINDEDRCLSNKFTLNINCIYGEN